MIRITAELVPNGDETNKQFLGVCEIWNTKSGTTDSGNYMFRISKIDPNVNMTIGEVKGFQRLTKSHWHLLFEALRIAFFTKREKRSKS
mgnify:CR=1 FL=1